MDSIIYFMECVVGGIVGSLISFWIMKWFHERRLNKQILEAEKQADIIRGRLNEYLTKYYDLKSSEVLEFKKRDV